MSETEPNPTITFRSPLFRWNSLLFLGSVLLISALLFALSNSKVVLFLIVPVGFVLFYGIRYLTLSNTDLRVENGFLYISQYNKHLNLTSNKSIAIDKIRGYEINEVSRGSQALFIYDQSFNHYKYSLLKIKDELAIDTYLQGHLKKLDANANPIFKSFVSAFLFSLKNASFFLTACFVAIASIYFANIKYKLEIGNVSIFIWSALLGLTLWWLLIRRPVKLRYFRFAAYYWFSNIFFYLSPLLILPALLISEGLNEKPIHLNYASEIINHPDKDLFVIEHVSYNPKIILLSGIEVRTKSGRVSKSAIDHSYATPMGSGDPITNLGVYNLWLARTDTQSIKKSTDSITRKELIKNFHSEAKHKFISSFNQKPVFYTVVEWNNQVRGLIQTSYNANLSVVIKPHWESISDYYQSIRNQVLLFVGAIIGLNLIGCIVIALNR